MYSFTPAAVIAAPFGNMTSEATIPLSVTFIMSQFATLKGDLTPAILRSGLAHCGKYRFNMGARAASLKDLARATQALGDSEQIRTYLIGPYRVTLPGTVTYERYFAHRNPDRPKIEENSRYPLDEQQLQERQVFLLPKSRPHAHLAMTPK